MRERLHLHQTRTIICIGGTMSGPTELLRHARQRAEALRARYRAAGFWSAAAGRRRARRPRRGIRRGSRCRAGAIELTYAELDERDRRWPAARWRTRASRASTPVSAGGRQRRGLGGRRARRDARSTRWCCWCRAAPGRRRSPTSSRARVRVTAWRRTGRRSPSRCRRRCTGSTLSMTTSRRGRATRSRCARPTSRPSCCTPRAPRPSRRA